MPFAVICPAAPDAFNPTAFAGVTVTTVPGDTVHAVPAATAGLGQTCAATGDTDQHAGNATTIN